MWDAQESIRNGFHAVTEDSANTATVAMMSKVADSFSSEEEPNQTRVRQDRFLDLVKPPFSTSGASKPMRRVLPENRRRFPECGHFIKSGDDYCHECFPDDKPPDHISPQTTQGAAKEKEKTPFIISFD